MCRSEQEDCHECSIRGDPLAAEASLLIPDRPFLTGLEGPIRKCFVSESVPGQAESTTSNLLFGSVQHTSPELGTSSSIRWGRTKLLTGVQLHQGDLRSRPTMCRLQRSSSSCSSLDWISMFVNWTVTFAIPPAACDARGAPPNVA
jgi:hypothetical protein